jgi:hypothetical protein
MTRLKIVILAAALVAGTTSLTMAHNGLHYTKRGHSPGMCGADVISCCCYTQRGVACAREGLCLNQLGGTCAVTGC